MVIFKNTPNEKTFAVPMNKTTILEVTDGTHIEIQARNNTYQAAWMEDDRVIVHSVVVPDSNEHAIEDWIEALSGTFPAGVTLSDTEPQVVDL